ncbi:non-hydrolyzing UDP-N-acetylglucosamine 2-epimerase [Zavarzinella formosa]|uniref:non-hydrolyzing UDP-N-acetylglucosamine 2-epimerase n=1 Tax=Zavarzinella formosa TaxID=360055 RepID=UPI0003054721|nr:UDP-N-acetylglucosamine 2-epimerase (non-hydrolyzing) [Zavarzinella formosa]
MTGFAPSKPSKPIVLTILGTRPEVIKLAPVIRQLDLYPDELTSVVVSTGQHRDLIRPMVELFKIRVNHHLECMTAGQPLSRLLARCLESLDTIIAEIKPDLILVQGDTTTALAGAQAAFHRGIPVGHVEAGLRTNNPMAPFPEEMNRRLVSRLTNWHFAPTRRNVENLLDEGVEPGTIFHTGNPIVDALQYIGLVGAPTPALRGVLEQTSGYRRITLTTHRRESFGDVLEGNLRVIREFIDANPEYCVVFPVHPNPVVRQATKDIFDAHPRLVCCDPMTYPDFVTLMGESCLLVSDSGGIQEEAPSLRKPVIVMREQTERPEAVESGFAMLAPTPDDLREALRRFALGSALPDCDNPFGAGDAGQQIVFAIRDQILRTRPVADEVFA